MSRGGLPARLVATHMVIAVGSLIAIGVAVDRSTERRAKEELAANLLGHARAIRAALPRDPRDAELLVRAVAGASRARFTIMRSDGTVIADSASGTTRRPNQGGQPEVRAAASGRVGIDHRMSDAEGGRILAVAIPARDGFIVRAARPDTSVRAAVSDTRRILLWSLLVTAALATLMGVVVGRGLGRPLRRMADQLGGAASGSTLEPDVAGPPELTTLGRAINTMAEETRSTVAGLAAETALREQILSAMSEGVVLVERRRVIYANPAARAMLAISGEQLPAFVPIERDLAQTVDVELRHPDPRELRITSAPLGDQRVLVVVSDVSTTNRLERTRRDFVANASHELKTPVSAILAVAETLVHAIEEDPAAARRFTDDLRSQALRLSRLVSELLDLSRLEQTTPARATVDLTAVARDVIEQLRPFAADREIQLLEQLNAPVTVEGSKDDLTLAVRNLTDNAIRYTPEGGEVTIAIDRHGSDAVITVADSGIGIPARDLPRIFERLYRVDPGRSRATGGTGIGLSIVKHVVESHGGRVTVESRLGLGSVFRVTLPSPPGGEPGGDGRGPG